MMKGRREEGNGFDAKLAGRKRFDATLAIRKGFFDAKLAERKGF